MTTQVNTLPGFYGKLPVRGDFICRHLPRSFVEPWDAWLQEAMACSRRQLDTQWLDRYLNSPLWRLVLSPGACGESAIAGVMMPSVDRVGRYFPLLIATALAGAGSLLELVENGDAWFHQAEQIALSALEDDLDLENFASQVEALGSPLVPDILEVVKPAVDNRAAWHCALRDPAVLPTIRAALAEPLLQRGFARYSLWWSQGSEHVAPCLLVCQGLPPPEGYAALLAGDWSRWGWADQALIPVRSVNAPPGDAEPPA